MPIKIGTGSSAVEPSELRLGLFSRPAVRVMVGTGNDAVPAYVRQVPPLEPKTVGATTQTFIPGYSDYGLFATFQVTGGGKGRFKVSLNGPYIDDYAGSFQRIFTIRINGNNVASWGKNTNKSDWIVTNQLSDEIEIPENATVEIWLQISTSNQSDRYLNSWSVELIPSEVEEPVDPIETVVIDATGYMGARNQFRDALTARGLDYQTVTTIPFEMDTSGATNLDSLFSFCSELTEVPDLDTSNVTNMSSMFQSCGSLSEVPEMDTSNVTNMSSMFQSCGSLSEVPEMDTSNVTNMSSMFQSCGSLSEVPEMDTSNVTSMNNMFSSTMLTTVPVMDTSNVTNMNAMYAFNPSLTEVPEMDTSKVTDMQYMFAWCTALTYVPDMDTSNVTNMLAMLQGTQSLTDGNIRLIGKHPDVNTASMIEMSGLTVEPFFVPAVETQTALSVVPSEVTEGESISLTATVTPADAVGSVTFTVAGETSVVEVVEGVAATTLTVDQVGSHEVSADFIPADTDDFIASVDTTWITVHEFVPAVETTTVLTVDPTEVIVGDSVTVTATVTPSDAEGYVALGMQGGSWNVDVVDGVATTTNRTYIVGDQEYTASFVPTNPEDFTPSSAEPVVVTTLPVPAVETTTVLSVMPDEIEEGESVTVTATVTPAEAAGVVEFDVAGQLSTVNVAGGVATTTATLEEAGDYDITADFIPANEADFLPSSATGSITVVEGGPIELVPMSWSGGNIADIPDTEFEVLNYTVVGSGSANFTVNFEADGYNGSSWSKGGSTRRIYIYINGTYVGGRSWANIGLNVYNWTLSNVPLVDGDTLTFSLSNNSARERAINWWSLDLVPV